MEEYENPDHVLEFTADLLDDLERVRIANSNRLGRMTRVGLDKDGKERGFAMPEDHPAVVAMRGIVENLEKVDHQASLELQKAMRKHPLGPFVKQQKGWGDRQIARLLAAIGDPYLREVPDEDGESLFTPRTVSQLWAYCGLHTLPAAGQTSIDTQVAGAGGGNQPGNQDQTRGDVQSTPVLVAARRARGQQANWSTTAKMRAWNVATSIVKTKGEWRDVYDKRRANTAGRVHAAPCVRCGPKGKPAQPGTPWPLAHQHADALRIVSKEVLKALWRESKRLHGME